MMLNARYQLTQKGKYLEQMKLYVIFLQYSKLPNTFVSTEIPSAQRSLSNIYYKPWSTSNMLTWPQPHDHMNLTGTFFAQHNSNIDGGPMGIWKKKQKNILMKQVNFPNLVLGTAQFSRISFSQLIYKILIYNFMFSYIISFLAACSNIWTCVCSL